MFDSSGELSMDIGETLGLERISIRAQMGPLIFKHYTYTTILVILASNKT